MILRVENRSVQRKTCPSATLSATNLTGPEPGSNPGLQSERPAANAPHTHTHTHTHHHLHGACTGNTKWRRQGTLQKNNALSEVGEDFLEKCPDHLKPEDEGSMILINIGMHPELRDVI
jgi:hypothetical protein